VLGGKRQHPSGGEKTLVGGPGNDGVQAGIGSSNLLGGPGDDYVHGDNGSDRAVVGGEGKDLVDGANGSDRMIGGGGGDWLFDGPLDEASKDDVLSGGEGDDVILSDHAPAVRDIVSCGGGLDRLIADRKDVVADDCERVRVVHGSEAEVTEQEQAFFETVPPAVLEFFGVLEDFGPFYDRLAPYPTAGG
jgi:Ca2+-binding RTX toxin-like protein